MTSETDTSPDPAMSETEGEGHRAGGSAGLWLSFVSRRGLGLVANVVALIVLTFFMVLLIPGDPAAAIAGDNATLEQLESIREEMGLNQSIPSQFAQYVGGVFHGDFGNSFKHPGVSAWSIVMRALPYTMSIALVGILLVLLLGVGIGLTVGILTRGDRNRGLGSVFAWVTSLLSAIPPYITATLLVVIVAIWMGILPAGYSSQSGWTAAVLPIFALALGPASVVARVVRREAAVVMEQDYMRTAQGWRLPPWLRYFKHMLPNLLTTALTLSGLILTGMLGSALIVEKVFAWPGLGTTIIDAIATSRDYPVIRAGVFVVGLIATIITIVVDAVLGVVDPRTLGGNRG